VTKWMDGSRMPLRLDPYGSVFVVFRHPAEAGSIISLTKADPPASSNSPAAVGGAPTIETLQNEDATIGLRIWESRHLRAENRHGKDPPHRASRRPAAFGNRWPVGVAVSPPAPAHRPGRDAGGTHLPGPSIPSPA